MSTSRNVSNAKKKLVAGAQFYKCANNPSSDIDKLKHYKCPLWLKDDENKGCFDESGYEIDHIVEHSLTQDDTIDNLQALCKMCHSVKTKRFIIKNTDNVKKPDPDFIEMARYHTFSDEEKDIFWMKESNEHYVDIISYRRQQMVTQSRNVEHYLNASDIEKETLWHEYGFSSRLYCNVDRWRDEITKKRQIKSYAKKLLPKSKITITIK